MTTADTAGEVRGLISTLQRYSTKDGPGIRTTAFLVGCNLRCAWCANPELMLPGEKYLYYRQRCVRCGSCVSISGGKVTLGEDGCLIDRKASPDWEALADICPQSAYEKKGIMISSRELAERLLRDRDFYEVSGGGVTFSGGEAALQGAFVRQTVSSLRAAGVHTALDTAGLIPWGSLEKVLEEIDLVLYDIKAFDPALHRKCTGQANGLILENARRIAASGKPMWIRLVLVPGWNDDLLDMRERLRFVRSLGGAVQRVDLLKYHSLGQSKYVQLGLPYPVAEGTACSDELTEQVCRIAREEGVELQIEN